MSIKKRNNKINIIVIGCATIAIATVGFSSWIIGLFQTEVNAEFTNIQVDTTKDRTKYIDIKLASNSIKIGEVNSVDKNGQIYVENSDNNLEVNVSSFDVAFNIYSGKFNSINFEILNSSDSDLSYSIKAENDLFGRSIGKYTFLELGWSNIEGVDSLNKYFSKNTIENYTLYSLDSTSENPYSKLSFKWGTLFDRKNPSKYYQEKFNSANQIKASTETKLKMLSQMENELNAMKTALSGKDITVKATLNLTFNN